MAARPANCWKFRALQAVLLALTGFQRSAAVRYGSLCVSGTVECRTNEKDAASQIVKLWDHDPVYDLRDPVAQSVTRRRSPYKFNFCGKFKHAVVYITIYTDCNSTSFNSSTGESCFRLLPYRFEAPQALEGSDDLKIDKIFTLDEHQHNEVEKCYLNEDLVSSKGEKSMIERFSHKLKHWWNSIFG